MTKPVRPVAGGGHAFATASVPPLETPPPPADLREDLRGAAFDATVPDNDGLRPIGDGDNRAKLARLLTDPSIASHRIGRSF